MHIDASGLDRLPDGPTVLAVNHPSFADGFVLAAMLPERYTFVAAGELGSGLYVNPIVPEMVARVSRTVFALSRI